MVAAVGHLRLAGLLFGALLVLLAGTAFAGSLRDAVASYDRGDYVTAMQLFRPYADEGHAGGQTAVARMYQKGQGVTRDYAEAARWYRKAADQGEAFAQISLGAMYVKGEGVPQDYAEAVTWYRKAADQGLADAQAHLGAT